MAVTAGQMLNHPRCECVVARVVNNVLGLILAQMDVGFKMSCLLASVIHIRFSCRTIAARGNGGRRKGAAGAGCNLGCPSRSLSRTSSSISSSQSSQAGSRVQRPFAHRASNRVNFYILNKLSIAIVTGLTTASKTEMGSAQACDVVTPNGELDDLLDVIDTLGTILEIFEITSAGKHSPYKSGSDASFAPGIY